MHPQSQDPLERLLLGPSVVIMELFSPDPPSLEFVRGGLLSELFFSLVHSTIFIF